jgi:uncharacterized delta-60 repeat protein
MKMDLSGSYSRRGTNAVPHHSPKLPDLVPLIQSFLCLWIGAGIVSIQAAAQEGSVDPSFAPDERLGCADNAYIQCVAVLSNGRVLVGGGFYYNINDGNGNVVQYLSVARLFTDGSLDLSFTPPETRNPLGVDSIDALVVQPDGRILVGGTPQDLNGSRPSGLARLLSDGSVDPNFNPAFAITGHGAEVYSLALQPDGKILVGGQFSAVNGVPRSGIARLTPDGQLDATFDPGTGIGVDEDAQVNSVVLQRDGKILIGGEFKYYNGQPRSCLTRLNANGTLDKTFAPNLTVIYPFFRSQVCGAAT